MRSRGDAFAPRNRFALNIDDEVDPPMFKISDTHYRGHMAAGPPRPQGGDAAGAEGAHCPHESRSKKDRGGGSKWQHRALPRC